MTTPKKSHRSTPSVTSLSSSSLYAIASNSNGGLERSPTFGNFDFVGNSVSSSGGVGRSGTGGSSGGRNEFGKDYEEIQNKTFCKWLNARLVPQYLPLEDLAKDFSDGTRLIQLIEVLTGESLGRYSPASPTMLKVQKAENILIALRKIKDMDITLTNIGAEDIIEGNRKLILGLIWCLVVRFVIADINEEGLLAKDGLLLWCQRTTAAYPEVNILNFNKSWQDGFAFCALIHRHRPDLIDWNSLSKDPLHAAEINTRLAFKIAEKDLNIPQLLEVEDVCGHKKPDDRSVMTYVAQFFHAFSVQAREQTDARVISSFVEYVGNLWEGENDYERRANTFRNEVETYITNLSYPLPITYASLRQRQSELATFQESIKRDLTKERLELKMLLRNIQIKAISYGLRHFDPVAPIDLDSLDHLWNELGSVEREFGRKIGKSLRRLREEAMSELARAERDFSEEVEEVHQELAGITSPSLEHQLVQLRKLDLSRSISLLSDLETIHNLCTTYEIRPIDHESSPLPLATAQYSLEILTKSLQTRKNFIENQLVARATGNVSPEAKEEFETSFKSFSKHKPNYLIFDELVNALGSLGYAESTYERVFDGMRDEEGYISFKSFIDYLTEKTEDRVTFDKVRDCFRNLTNGEPYLAEIDFTRIELPAASKAATIDFLKNHLYRVEFEGEGNEMDEKYYDFESYLKSIFIEVEEGGKRPRRSIA